MPPTSNIFVPIATEHFGSAKFELRESRICLAPTI